MIFQNVVIDLKLVVCANKCIFSQGISSPYGWFALHKKGVEKDSNFTIQVQSAPNPHRSYDLKESLCKDKRGGESLCKNPLTACSKVQQQQYTE